MGRLFGTDGVRGVANTELTCELAFSIGRAAAFVLLKESGNSPRVLIGKDTRASGDMLESALAAGLCSVGANVELLGVVPTPAVAYLVGKYNADAGIMVSASHNPCEYNGIKIFNGQGYKLSDALEEEIEAIILDNAEELPTPTHGALGRVSTRETAAADYVDHLLTAVDGDLKGMKIAVDCANGSASTTARSLFEALNADCVILNEKPDGVNINDKCGSTHLEMLAAAVKENGCCAGVAFDGDADRCLAVDENGNEIDGDQMIAALAIDMKEKGKLPGDTAVVTVMSNLGFIRCCESHGITPETTKVGDRYVLEKMLADGFVIGGEQSGHIILSDYATTGDGQLSAIKLLRLCAEKKANLSQVCNVMTKFPQMLVNLRVTPEKKAAYLADQELAARIQAVHESLGRSGRVLVRVSGTEPLIRVMVEGENQEQIEATVKVLVDDINATLG